MIFVEDLMASLAQRRTVFCSEADFQHELAYEFGVVVLPSTSNWNDHSPPQFGEQLT
ncbi:hypothetical protein [Novosphingobium sp.]|uniref:hypothetical protein n=1 Tax=Novosphingobium sp. TaxID=1874826 RepID=UPI002FDE016D